MTLSLFLFGPKEPLCFPTFNFLSLYNSVKLVVYLQMNFAMVIQFGKLRFYFYKLFAAISIDPNHETLPKVMKVRMHLPSASRILLPDGRYVAYRDQGVPAGRARFSLVAPHSFQSSRLAGKIK